MATISVLIPTWQRPDELTRCLVALQAQSRPADQVVVSVREDDRATHDRLGELAATGRLPNGFEAITVGPVPLTASMNAGLARTVGDLVALTDDDAAPFTDWLERLEEPFFDPTIGGVGGRDWQPHERGNVEPVGLVSWFGRVVGNHHLGHGARRDVDLLKGVNACFRGELLRRTGFDTRLRGRGNVSHWELSLCLTLRRAGWRLIYDPAIAVDHFPAQRHDGDVNARGGFESRSYAEAVHNGTLPVLEYVTLPGRIAWFAWALACGTRGEPGLLQAARLTVLRSPDVIGRWRATFSGRLQGIRSYFSGMGVTAAVGPFAEAERRATRARRSAGT